MTKTAFISGHLDLTQDEFDTHYAPRIHDAIAKGHSFVVGDARGADTMAQEYLHDMVAAGHLDNDMVTVYHAYKQPRNCIGFDCKGDYPSQNAKDKAMTLASDYDILWVREGREESGTARNFARRKGMVK